MLNWGLFKKHTAVVGIELQAEGVALVAMQTQDGISTVTHMSFIEAEDFAAGLKDWVSRHKLTQSRCHVAMAADQYQILLVEPPEVPEEELRNAIRWRLKDLITIPLEHAAIDVFALPEDGTRSKKKMVYVVAAHAEKVKSVVALVNNASLQLHAVDIGELALRNIANLLICDDQSRRGIAVARIRRGTGSMYIYREGDMYLARSFSLDYKGGLLDELPEENLALELQRSVDYYERQMGQAPPNVIYVCGENISEDKLGPVLKASLGSRIQLLDPAAVVRLDDGVDNDLSQRCIGAIGVAMRQEQAS